MKILYYHRTLADGAEGIHIREIVNSFRSMGHEVKVVSLLSDEAAVPESGGHRLKGNFKDKVIEKIRWLLPDFAYEIAEMVTNIPAWRLVNKSIKEFQPDFIYERYSNYGIAASYAAKKNSIPIILEANVPYYEYKKEWEKVYFPGLLKWTERKVFESVSHIVVVSTTLKKSVLKYGISENRITVMPNGVNAELFYPLGLKDKYKNKHQIHSEIVLGFIGAVRRWHKMDQLIKTLHEIGLDQYNAKMLIIGECSFMDELKEYAKSLGEENNILFLGRLPHDKMPEYLEMIDIAISPFAVKHSSPMKILEYMAMGKCVIAPDMENIRDIIKPDQTGLLFKPDDPIELKNKLLLSLNDPALRSNIAKAGCDDVVTHFSWMKNAKWVIELYKKVKPDVKKSVQLCSG